MIITTYASIFSGKLEDRRGDAIEEVDPVQEEVCAAVVDVVGDQLTRVRLGQWEELGEG